MTDSSSALKEAARWFAVQRRNVMTVHERESLDHWLADPANRAALAQMERSWEIAGRLASQAAAAPPLPPPAPAFTRRAALRAAGGLAASVTVGVIAAESRLLSSWGWDGEVETGVGEQREITLADGSVIHLNVMSRVRWRLTETERQVALEAGDALFTVSRNAERPFTVRAAGTSVRVLGTVFSVSVRDQAGGVAVREGHVAVTPALAAEPVQLLAGQGVRFGRHGADKVAAVAPDQVGEWSDHFVTFDQAELGEVARELGRYFPLKVRIDPPEAATRRVTLRLKLHDQNSTLDLLSQLLEARIERKSATRVVMRLPS